MSDYYDDTYKEVPVPLLLYMTAGCIAGGIEAITCWPLEFIKVQLQLQKQSLPESTLDKKTDDDDIIRMEDVDNGKPNCHLPQPSQPIYTDMISGIIYTVRVHGCCALYHGLTPTLLGSIPKAGIRFGLDAWFGDLLARVYGGDDDGDNDEAMSSMGMYFLAGMEAGVVEALVVVVPVETIKTKCIELNMSFLRGLKEILVMEGIRGIYKGVSATLLKQGSNQGLRFMWYHEYVRIVTKDGTTNLTIWQSFVGGMTAGIFSTLSNHPCDVIKTKLQGIHAHEQYSSTCDCVCKTFRSEGIAGLYRGLVPRLARVVPGQGIIFMSFEIVLGLLIALYGS